MITTQQLSDDLIQGKQSIEEHIRATQSRLVNITLLTGTVMAFPALLASYVHAQTFGWNTFMYVQIASAVLIWITTLRRHRWSLRLRIVVLLSVAFLLGTGGLLTWGLISGDWNWFVIGSMLATVFLGLRYGEACIAGGFLIMLIIGAGICFGYLPSTTDSNTYAISYVSWLMTATTVFLFLFAVLLPIGILQKELLETIGIVQQQARNLKAANDRLQVEIRDREQVEKRLRESQERYTLAEKAAKIGVWDWNILTDHLRWSDSIGPMFGLQPGEFAETNDAFYECVHPDDRQRVRDAVRATLEQKAEYNIEHRIVWPDGTVHWVQEKGDIYRDEQGRPIRMLGVVLDITQRKSLQEALWESAERYRALAEASPDSIYMFDMSGVFRFINGPGARMVGRTPEEMIGLRQEDIFPPEQARKHTATLRHILETGAPVSEEGWVSLPDGNHWFDTRIVPLKNAEGQPIAILGISRDITKRKLAEKQLQESQERYTLAEKAAKIGVWDWNILTGELRWTNLIEPMFGFKPGEFAGTIDAFFECVHPDDRQHVHNAVRATSERGEEYNIEHRIIWPDGSVRWVQERGDIYRDEQGQPIRMLGVVLDITHRKYLEEALLESEERFRAIADYTYDWEEWIGPDGRPLWINPGGERLTGYSREECMTMPGYPIALIHEEDRQQAEHHFREAIRGSTGSNVPLRIRRKDGSIVHTLVSWQPIYDQQGRFLGCRSSIHDVTELRRVEEDRACLREQLLQAQKLEAVGRLASGIAHDFQNLLAVIKIHTELLGRAIVGQNNALGLLQVIQQVADQAKDMVQSLLMLSRSVPVEKKPIELTRTVQNITNILRTMLPVSIDLVTDLKPDRPVWINADVSGIQQVLMNLALNARDAMPKGGTLRIAVSNVSAEAVPNRPALSRDVRSWACITVSDTGRGIPPEIKPRIFEAFVSTKSKEKGTGLGLAVTHRIVEDHEGIIQVDSQLDHGSTFTVYLPQKAEEDLPAKQYPSEAPPKEQGRVILLAEDNWFLGKEIASLLRYTGHRVIRAEDGHSLLEQARQNHDALCLLILEADLPDEGGYEALRRLRKTGDRTPTILLTDSSEPLDSSNLDRYTTPLLKPFSWEAMIHLIGDLLVSHTDHPDQA